MHGDSRRARPREALARSHPMSASLQGMLRGKMYRAMDRDFRKSDLDFFKN